ncbi:ATP-binding protein [Sphingobacterium litopenaei]|uniref:histidine kinase n=1 Tax=Sphingobacterium litopenaei TaxID=2763500 RepID=A0ABR7YCM9_9SPHI|nr:ATP-binding protein [Sphingobacterium litopenaei]MBD1429061.1 GAF domain-containing protein [Sphingobacterium litopenaei]
MIKELKTLNCEEEPIHLCGKIQNFGYLIVFNLSGKCVAVSENCSEWLPFDLSSALHLELNDFLKNIPSDSPLDLNIKDFQILKQQPLSTKTKLNGRNYQLTLYVHNEKLFLEFEMNENMIIELNQLNEFQQNFERSENVWQTLCENIFKIIDFDRIMVYQFLEDSSGIVIAENKKLKEESILGYRYPEFDIPKQARQLYLKNLSRQTPDIHEKTIDIYGLSPEQIDLSKSQIRALSPMHLQYLDNFGVRASASFSIVIDNKLWGLVACQNIEPKYIPFDKRSLCLFVTQYAANKYLVKQQRIKIQQDHTIKEIELELKEKLFFSQSFEKTLSEFANRFMQTISATGLIIKSPDYTLRFGDTPNEYLLQDIHTEINKIVGNENIFTSHSFSLSANKNVDNKNWTGIARLCFDEDNEFAIYWFRKEIIAEEKWAGVPEKHQIFSKEKQAYIYSPRTSFQLWKKEVSGQSEKWSVFDNDFLVRIQKLIQESMLRKLNEVRRLNQKLIEANNALDTYTHQLAHDLKNPLSTIKTSAQFMQTRQDISQEFVARFSKNIADAASLINDIIDKTIESTKSSFNILKYELVATETFINQLIQQAIQRYKVQNFEIILGDLHPVFGEKTLLYQLFMNLINNAVKFSSKNSMTVLEIYSIIEDNKTVYFIKDNGIGIEETEKEKVFSIFKRLSNATQFEGSGVGMSIVKRIVDRLNAEISFESIIGSGTVFKIKFPNE